MQMFVTVKKWTLRVVIGFLLLIILFVTLILNPSILYAHKTRLGNFNIYHNKSVDPSLIVRLNESVEIIKTSSLFDPSLKFDICLNDGSWYPSIIKTIFNEPIGTTFYNKIVFWGTIDFKENYALDAGHKWNMTQLIAHTEIHCLQFNERGLWKSNPVAGLPFWKWEGYAEYISRRSGANIHLSENIKRWLPLENNKNNWIDFSDGTGSSMTFYRMRLLVQFCTEIKQMNFDQLLKDTRSEEDISAEMMRWYQEHSIQ